MRRLPNISYLSFPFRVDRGGAAASSRRAHVREQIEQVLFTAAGERQFRPEFGAGVKRLVFEPNAPVVRELTRKRLMAALVEALQGEVDPRTLEIDADADESGEALIIVVRYRLAAIGEREEHRFTITSGSDSHG